MSTRIGHVALGRSSEAEADRFFVELLGCERTRTRDLPTELGALFFGLAGPCRMIDYERGGVRFEVFVPERPAPAAEGYGHVCLVVEDRADLLARATAAGQTVLRVERDGREVVFLRDGDDNLYEIQQAP